MIESGKEEQRQRCLFTIEIQCCQAETYSRVPRGQFIIETSPGWLDLPLVGIDFIGVMKTVPPLEVLLYI